MLISKKEEKESQKKLILNAILLILNYLCCAILKQSNLYYLSLYISMRLLTYCAKDIIIGKVEKHFEAKNLARNTACRVSHWADPQARWKLVWKSYCNFASCWNGCFRHNLERIICVLPFVRNCVINWYSPLVHSA